MIRNSFLRKIYMISLFLKFLDVKINSIVRSHGNAANPEMNLEISLIIS